MGVLVEPENLVVCSLADCAPPPPAFLLLRVVWLLCSQDCCETAACADLANRWTVADIQDQWSKFATRGFCWRAAVFGMKCDQDDDNDAPRIGDGESATAAGEVGTLQIAISEMRVRATKLAGKLGFDGKCVVDELADKLAEKLGFALSGTGYRLAR